MQITIELSRQFSGTSL